MKANTNRTGQLFHQQHSVVHTMNYSMSKKNQWEQNEEPWEIKTLDDRGNWHVTYIIHLHHLNMKSWK